MAFALAYNFLAFLNLLFDTLYVNFLVVFVTIVFLHFLSRDEVDAKASTSYTAQGAVFALSERGSCARRFEVSPAGSVVTLCILNLCEKIAKKC